MQVYLYKMIVNVVGWIEIEAGLDVCFFGCFRTPWRKQPVCLLAMKRRVQSQYFPNCIALITIANVTEYSKKRERRLRGLQDKDGQKGPLPGGLNGGSNLIHTFA